MPRTVTMAQRKNDAKQLALELDLGTKADTLDFDLKPGT